MAKGTKKDRVAILLVGAVLLLIVAAPFLSTVLDYRVGSGSGIPVILILATAIGFGSIGFWFLTGTGQWGGEGITLRTHADGQSPVLRFSGSVVELGPSGPGSGIRGSLEIFGKDGTATGRTRHFRDFDELKKILEEEYGKEA